MSRNVIHEDKISLLRRSFGVVFLSIAALITVVLMDHFNCTFGVFNDSCGQLSPGMRPMTNQNIFNTPLPIGIFFITVLTICGCFFGFFHGKQSVHLGYLNVDRYLFGIRFNSSRLAKLSDFNEVRVMSQKGFGQMTYHLIRTPEKDTFRIELVGPKEMKLVALFLDPMLAKSYTDNLVKVTGYPLREVVLKDRT